MQIKAVLFDLDDTLWPMLPVIEHAEQALYRWLQVHAPGVVLHHSIGSLRRLRAALLASDPRFQFDLWALRHAALTKVFAEYGEDTGKVDMAMQVFARARSEVSLYGDVVPGLIALGERWVLGSISNGFADLSVSGLSTYFKVSLAAHQFGCAKPDPAIFLAACAALNVAPQHALYVGDDLRCDVQGAQQAGLHSIWMNRTQQPGSATIIADHECHDLYGVLQCLHLAK